MAFRVAWVVLLIVGAVTSLKTVWSFADIANALMVLPNLYCIWLLSSELAKDTKEASKKEL